LSYTPKLVHDSGNDPLTNSLSENLARPETRRVC